MKVESPVERFPGYVILPDFLTYPQVFAFEDALAEGRKYTDEETGTITNQRRYLHTILAGVIACVVEWHIEGVEESPAADTFPATPSAPASELAAWLIGEVTALFRDAQDVPLSS